MAEPAAAPGPATGDGTAAGGAQQVGQGSLFPPPTTPEWDILSPPARGFPNDVLLGHSRKSSWGLAGGGREGFEGGGLEGGVYLGLIGGWKGRWAESWSGLALVDRGKEGGINLG